MYPLILLVKPEIKNFQIENFCYGKLKGYFTLELADFLKQKGKLTKTGKAYIKRGIEKKMTRFTMDINISNQIRFRYHR